jgi:hypothetical protein
MMRPRRHTPEPDHDYPRASLPTGYGELQLTVLDADLVGVSTPYPDGFITVNRVQVKLFGSTLRRAKHGTWAWEDATRISVDRRDGRRASGTYHGVSWNAFDKLCDAVPPALRKWADAHPDLLTAGAVATRTQRLHTLKTELDQTVEQASSLRSQIETLSDEIAALQHGAT